LQLVFPRFRFADYLLGGARLAPGDALLAPTPDGDRPRQGASKGSSGGIARLGALGVGEAIHARARTATLRKLTVATGRFGAGDVGRHGQTPNAVCLAIRVPAGTREATRLSAVYVKRGNRLIGINITTRLAHRRRHAPQDRQDGDAPKTRSPSNPPRHPLIPLFRLVASLSAKMGRAG
jgi:hypothetical protein